MTRVLGLVRKIDAEMLALASFGIAGIFLVALSRWLAPIVMFTSFVILFVVFWITLLKIRWNRDPYRNAPTRMKVAYVVFTNFTLLSVLTIIILAANSIVKQESAFTVLSIMVLGVLAWFIVAIVIIGIGYIPLMLARIKKEGQENHS